MTYVLIPGAGCTPWHWHPLTAELEARGHEVIAVDLPCDDESAGLASYCEAVVTAVGRRTELVVVAHSLGGFTAPAVCERLPVELMVFVAGMIPLPGEAVSDYWGHTDYKWDGDPESDYFFQDLPAELAVEARRRLRAQAGRPMDDPALFERWPEVPTRAVIATDDLLFPADYLRALTVDRLGFAPAELPGGHFPMLGHAGELAELLETYRREVQGREK
ncbi:alpha/beta hydrolase family protein [Kribbella voronezhensis]|uniref:Alpha/beta hydrolase family protein n=1 Tax=Kribbella voronezhensis TaxID=2512212 RepID=A0A4R7TCS8_9ACTN|nr:alpha/beta hydrolase [Kribbella voronezhensis]TDU89920.1 alpha/beta hydrolase family protein [Kribbella voronezhensis]